MTMIGLILGLLTITRCAWMTSSSPHIVYLLVDDWGWADADWHRNEDWNETANPIMTKALRNEGIELDQHYAYKFCSPSRSAIQSGRNPIHVNVQNYQPVVWNERNPNINTGFAGIPVNMTVIAQILKREKGYATHFVGKWDCGMGTNMHTPKARGYDTSMFYFHHDNDYWTSRVRTADSQPKCPGQSHVLVDLWENDGPSSLNNSALECDLATNNNNTLPYPVIDDSHDENPRCVFEDELFLDHVLDIIRSHDANEKPLFLFWAAHVVHGPLQVPKTFYEMYNHVDDDRRRRYLSMVRWLDTAFGNVTNLLKQKGLYEDTLVVVHSDNGGPIYFGGSGGANNWPLRGGKTSNFQVRAQQAITVPCSRHMTHCPRHRNSRAGSEQMRSSWEVSYLHMSGVRNSMDCTCTASHDPKSTSDTSIFRAYDKRPRCLENRMTAWDWYATLANAADIDDVSDHTAKDAGLPPIDSVSMWEYITGKVSTSPRKRVPIGSTTCANASLPNCFNKWGWGQVNTTVAGLIEDRRDGDGEGGLWKLLIDQNPMNGWTGPRYPNISTAAHAFNFSSIQSCGSHGCLFRLDSDPSEHHDLASTHENVARDMLTTIRTLNTSVFSPDRGIGEEFPSVFRAACNAAVHRYGGYYGPWWE